MANEDAVTDFFYRAVHTATVAGKQFVQNWYSGALARSYFFGCSDGGREGMVEAMRYPADFDGYIVGAAVGPARGLNPAQAAPLSDAALTPYHAIKRALPQLNADTTVVVLGVGGLGHMAVQLVRVLAPVRIIAADVEATKLEQAKALGADDVVSTQHVDAAAEQIRHSTGPRGAGLVLDCVGVQATVDLGAKLLGRNCVWTIVGLGGGHHDFHHGSTPYGCVMSIPYWGSRIESMEVIAMARDGRIRAETTEFPLAQAVEVYDKLKAGQIRGRAVLIPDGA